MNLIILNGPTGTGKNTIAEIVAQKREKCAVIDFDVLRNMFRKPHKTPWDGEAGYKQNVLGLEHACMLAKSFLDNGYDCIILDVLYDETANLYKEKLKEYKPVLVLLLPTWEEIKRRNETRPPRLKAEELEMVYKQQSELQVYDKKIDNTDLSPEEVALKIVELMN